MEEMFTVIHIDAFLAHISAFPDSLIYLILGLSAFIENIFPLAPGDTVTAFGAFLVGTRNLSFIGVYIATTLGSLTGFMFLFWLGALLGKRYFIERDLWLFKAQDIERAEIWFRKYGYFIILINRFFPGIRSVISISAGISKLNRQKVALLALISAFAWNLIWMGFGYMLGSNWERVKDKLGVIMVRYNTGVLTFLGLFILFFVIRWWLKNKKT